MPGCYYLEQRKDIVLWYALCQCFTVVIRQFKSKYVKLSVSKYENLRSTIQRFDLKFTLNNDQRPGRPRGTRSEDNIVTIRDIMEVTPTKSMHEVANDTQIGSRRVSAASLSKISCSRPLKERIIRNLETITSKEDLNSHWIC